MTKALVIGDPHCRVSFLQDFDKLAAATVELALAARPDFIVVTGDSLHNHADVHTVAFNRVIKWARELAEAAPVYWLIGNHDLINSTLVLSKEHPFALLRSESITVVDEPTVAMIGGLSFAFMPYVPPGMFLKTLEQAGVTPDAHACIFGHQEFRGADMGGFISKDGDDWESKTLVISGHIHLRGMLSDNIVYVGSPMAHSFGEDGDKTVSMFLFGPTGHTEDVISLPLPRRITQDITLEEAMTGTFSNPAPDYLRLRIRGAAPALAAFRKSARYKELASIDIKLVLEPEDAVIIQKHQKTTYLVELTELIAQDQQVTPEDLEAALREARA